MWIVYFERIRTYGTRVILATEPVDPRSLLRGDYVILDYVINSPGGQIVLPEEWETIDVYTVLSLDDTWRVESYQHSLTKPSSGTFIKWQLAWQPYKWRNQIDYGIEQYFVPEGKWWTIERLGRVWWDNSFGDELEVRVAISSSGVAQILELLIDGEPVDFWEIEAENPYR